MNSSSTKERIVILDSMVGQRLDKALTECGLFPSRHQIQNYIEKQCIYVNAKVPKASYKLLANDIVEILWPLKNEKQFLQPLHLDLHICHEDDDVMVINKPAGLVVHPAAGHAEDTLVNALIAHNPFFQSDTNNLRPGIVHRIDKDTSGLLVVAKNVKAHEFLSQQFKNKTVHRIYYAVAVGHIQSTQGTMQSYLQRHPINRKIFSSVKNTNSQEIVGKWAVTHFKVLQKVNQLSYLQLQLETGRTHQIRVHLAESGHPIIGDTAYGAEKKYRSILNTKIITEAKNLKRFLLHAAELGFTHPTEKKIMSFSVPWPEDDAILMTSWGLNI